MESLKTLQPVVVSRKNVHMLFALCSCTCVSTGVGGNVERET